MDRIFSVVVLSLLVAGCTVAKGPKFTSLEGINKDIAILYFYRPNLGYWQSAYTPWLELNDEEFVDLHKGGYTRIYVEAGKYKLALKTNILSGNPDVDTLLTVRKGDRRFFEVKDPVSVKYIDTPEEKAEIRKDWSYLKKINTPMTTNGFLSTWSSFLNEVPKSKALEILKKLRLDEATAFDRVPPKKLRS